MSFGGSVAAMITSLKNNALPKRTKYFDRNFEKEEFKKPFYEKATKQQIDDVVSRIQQEKRKQTFKNVLALIVSLSIIVGLIFVITLIFKDGIPDFLKFVF